MINIQNVQKVRQPCNDLSRHCSCSAQTRAPPSGGKFLQQDGADRVPRQAAPPGPSSRFYKYDCTICNFDLIFFTFFNAMSLA